MGMDYAGLNSGISRGMLAGMQIVRAKQQDDRQAALDVEDRLMREEERGMRAADRAYQEEERTYLRGKRKKADAREAAQERLNALNSLQRDQYGQPKPLDETGLATLTRFVQEDDDLQKEFVGGNSDAVGFAGFRPGEGRFHGQLVPMLKMRDGYGYGSEEDGTFVPQPYAPLTKNRKRDGKVYALTPDELADNLTSVYIGRGAKYDYATEKKAKELKTAKVGAGNGMMQEVIVNNDGTTTPLGKPYAQFDTQRKAVEGSGSSLPAEAKLIDYYINQHGMTKEEAREEAKRAKDSPRKWAGDHYRALVELEANRYLYEGEVRRTPEELREQAMADVEYFFGGEGKPGLLPTRGPSVSTPVVSAPAAAGMAAPTISRAQPAVQALAPPPAGGVKASMEGDVVTVGGKQYKAVDGMVTIDGKKYWVDGGAGN